MPINNTEIERRLWDAADELRANSRLRPSEYYLPVMGLIFLRYADHKFTVADEQIRAQRATTAGRRQRPLTPADYHARGVLYLPDEARFSHLVRLPEGENIARAITNAMKAVEEHNPDLKNVLPKTYNRLDNSTLVTLLKNFHAIQMDSGVKRRSSSALASTMPTISLSRTSSHSQGNRVSTSSTCRMSYQMSGALSLAKPLPMANR